METLEAVQILVPYLEMLFTQHPVEIKVILQHLPFEFCGFPW